MKIMTKEKAHKKIGKRLRWGRKGHPYTEGLVGEILKLSSDEVIYVPMREWPLKQTLPAWLGSARHMRRSRLEGVTAHSNKTEDGKGWVIYEGKY